MPRIAWIVLSACTASTSSNPPPPDPRAPMTAGASTLGGWAEPGHVDGPRDVNLFANPVNVAVGPDALVYVADFDTGFLRTLDAAGNAATVAVDARLARPFGLAFAGSVLYVETDNDPNGAHSSTSGTIWRVDVAAGTARAIASNLGRPRGMTALRDGRLAVADYVHHVVELFDPSDGSVTQLAGAWDTPGFVDGDGHDARFAEPYGIVQRADGALVVADHANAALRVVTLTGDTTTLAGAAAGLDHPQGLAIDAADDLYVSDTGDFRIRRVHAGAIETIAGDGQAGYADNDDPLRAELYGLEGIAVTADGAKVFSADGTRGENVLYNRVRMIERVR